MASRKLVICTFTFLFCSVLFVNQAFCLSLEQVASSRQSTRSFISTDVSQQQLLDVLRSAYGYTNTRRNTPKIGSDYSLVVFTVNSTGSYQYNPESNSVEAHDLTVNKETIRSYVQDWPSDASEVLVIVWNENLMDNYYFASAEAGCLAQNVHLVAASLGLGTCVVGGINSGSLRTALELSANLTPLCAMPLGYPIVSYPEASPDYSIMNGNLPSVLSSAASFEDALTNMEFVQGWSSEPLSLQELSQLLWASYGYSSTDHRTTPSAMGIYPLIVYFANATGVYQYLPETHSVTRLLSGDKRPGIANTFSGQTWAAEAPTIFVIGCDSSYNGGNTGDGGFLSHLWMEINTGCVIQQLLLEASACNLQTNILSQGLDDWNGAGAQQLRGILGLQNSIIPLYAVPVGASDGADSTVPTIGAPIQEPASAVEPNQSVTVFVEVTDAGVGVREVVLFYSTNSGQSWTDVTMTCVSGNVYSAEIPGFAAETNVCYKIVAYDNVDNSATKDNAGNYYIYTVIPEFQFLILAFIVSTLLAVALTKISCIGGKTKQQTN